MHGARREVSKPAAVTADRLERRPVSMPGVALLRDGSTQQIHLLDLSYEGCAVEASIALEPGQRIKLSVLGRGAIDAEVRWWKDGKAGLVFAPDPRAARKRQPRQSARISLAAEVTLRRTGKSNFRVNVFDASPQGCKIDLVERPAVGERVMIKFEGLEAMDADVCWVEQFTAGLQLRKPMHPAVFDLLMERLKG